MVCVVYIERLLVVKNQRVFRSSFYTATHAACAPQQLNLHKNFYNGTTTIFNVSSKSVGNCGSHFRGQNLCVPPRQKGKK